MGSLSFQLASLPQAHCRFNWLFIATGSLPFQLVSLPWAHCHFNWLHCHGLIALSIGFIATSSLPFQLALMPWVHCHSISFIAFSWVHCFSNRNTAANPLHPFAFCAHSYLDGTPFVFWHPHLPQWHPICLYGAPFALMAPRLPFGAPYAFSGTLSALWHHIRLSAPPSHWQPKGTSAREVTLVLWRAYQQLVKWHPILFPHGRMWLNPHQHFVWPLKKDGSSHPSWTAMWRIVLAILASSQNFGLRKAKFWQRSSHQKVIWASLIPKIPVLKTQQSIGVA